MQLPIDFKYKPGSFIQLNLHLTCVLLVSQGDADKTDINPQYKMAVKFKYATALYHNVNVTRSTFYMKSFILFSKVHNFCTMLLYYMYS